MIKDRLHRRLAYTALAVSSFVTIDQLWGTLFGEKFDPVVALGSLATAIVCAVLILKK